MAKNIPKIPYAPLRRLLKSLLDTSYEGHEMNCLGCASVNCDVSEFVDKYIKKVKIGRVCMSCRRWGSHGDCELDGKTRVGRDSCRLWRSRGTLKQQLKKQKPVGRTPGGV